MVPLPAFDFIYDNIDSLISSLKHEVLENT
jgi:hypothetical protein